MQTRFPSVSEYRASLERPAELFRSIEIEEVCRDVYGEIELHSGNSAAVFRIRTKESDRTMCLRCFRKSNPHLPQVYRYMSQCARRSSPRAGITSRRCAWLRSPTPVTATTTWRSRNGWRGGLCNTHTLGGKRRDRKALGRLARLFDEMCGQLLRHQWAHGDLKPENIIITPDFEARLIDYDAAYIPESGFDSTPEIGTPAYQHPGRTTEMYDKHIDDYSMILLSANLHLLSLSPHLMSADDENLPLCAREIFSGDAAGSRHRAAPFRPSPPTPAATAAASCFCPRRRT